MNDRTSVAVIGAGFSGVLTALRLLLSPDGPTVRLIEKGPRFGRGAAYSTGSPHHLLNVRATNMSAFAERPSHFVDWLGDQGHADRMFVTRDQYGQYLQSLLREATSGPGARRLTLEHDDAHALEWRDGRWEITLGVGRVVKADTVVLAIGNLPPPPPEAADPAVIASRRFVRDPWAWNPANDAWQGDVLLLGTGLTAIDVALSLEAVRPGVRITALSRQGLLPRSHAPATEPVPGPAGAIQRPASPPKGSPLALLRQLRRSSTDWRTAFDDLRPFVQNIWRGWSEAERRQFIRHLKPWWDVHRHRMAPEVAARIAAFQKDGILTVEAGRLTRLRLEADGVEASWAPRRGGDTKIQRFGLVVNCFGPQGDLEHADDPFVRALFDAGLARADSCRLGIEVDARSRVIGGSGEITPNLYAVGPISRGAYFEVTAVPDIRLQAADCAEAIIGVLNARTDERIAATPASEQTLAALRTMVGDAIAEIDVQLAGLKYTGRVRNAWELRGRRAALHEIATWLEQRP